MGKNVYYFMHNIQSNARGSSKQQKLITSEKNGQSWKAFINTISD